MVDFHFGFEGKTLVMNASVPDHCNFFLYGQTLFAMSLCIYSISNLTIFCIRSVMLKNFRSSMMC